jgi:hypothetical protein
MFEAAHSLAGERYTEILALRIQLTELRKQIDADNRLALDTIKTLLEG